MLKIIVPMAGRGQRFVDAGYAKPKPLVDVAGAPMIQRVIENLTPQNIEHRFVFIALAAHYSAELTAILSCGDVVLLEQLTVGSPQTVLCASGYVEPDDEAVIAACDQLVTPPVPSSTLMDDFVGTARSRGGVGLIMTFYSDSLACSYCALDNEGHVARVAEKVAISEHANVGIYYFRKYGDFVQAAHAAWHREGDHAAVHKGEYYVAPLYNYLVAKHAGTPSGAGIGIYHIAKEYVHILGSPDLLEAYLRGA